MFFQALFKQPNQEKLEIFPAEKLLILVRELLNKELPEHYTQHHILFTANTKLESLKNSLESHRNLVTPQSKIGQYHLEMHEKLRKEASDLQGLVDGYMELNIDMAQMNHRLHFYYDQIDYLHENYVQFMEGRFANQSSHLFWIAVKDDVLKIIRNIL